MGSLWQTGSCSTTNELEPVTFVVAKIRSHRQARRQHVATWALRPLDDFLVFEEQRHIRFDA
jgi:hypothetical protein